MKIYILIKIIKDGEKLLNKIKLSLEKCKCNEKEENNKDDNGDKQLINKTIEIEKILNLLLKKIK